MQFPTGRLFLEETRAVLRRVDEAVLAAKAAAGGERGELRIALRAVSYRGDCAPGLAHFSGGASRRAG